MNWKQLRWVVFVVASFLYFSPLAIYTPHSNPNARRSVSLPQLKTGDLVLIRGRSFLSEQLRKMNVSDQRYSHCGWVVYQRDTAWVYHIMGGNDHQETFIRKVTLDDFISPKDVLAFGIYRYQWPPSKLQAVTGQIKQWKAEGVTFDYAFDLGTDEQMYCSEMIFKAIKSIEDDLIMVNLDNVNGKNYVTLDNLYFNNPQTSKIFSYAYY